MTRTYHTLIPAVYVIFRRDQEVLLLKRANTGYKDGQYSLPSGHVEKEGTALQAAVREAQEEVGLKLDGSALGLAHTQHRAGEDGTGMDRIDMFFEITSWQGEPINNEPHKCAELRWARLDALPENVVGEVRQALRLITDDKSYSEYNFAKS